MISVKKFSIYVTLACFVAISHRFYLSHLFENEYSFSYLSNLEREISFKSEAGFYYSFYKNLINEASFAGGFKNLINDSTIEYPDVINPLQRFNLYPELISAFSYRIVQKIYSTLNLPSKLCHKVVRGQGLGEITSCEGIGEPIYFYLECVFTWSGLMLGIMFTIGVYMSDGELLGGLMSVLMFLYNHGESTRVHQVPALRESFGFPCWIIHLLVTLITLRNKEPPFVLKVANVISSLFFMLCWQFGQFVLLTQSSIAFVLYLFDILNVHQVSCISFGHLLGLILATILQFMNAMLIGSFLFASCLLILVFVKVKELYFKSSFKLWHTIFLPLYVFGCLALKYIISKLLNLDDDVHIIDILRSKLSSYKSFHTMLYTCAAEFDFIELQTFKELSKTGLLWLVAAVFFISSSHLLVTIYNNVKKCATREKVFHTKVDRSGNDNDDKKKNDGRDNDDDDDDHGSSSDDDDDDAYLHYMTLQLLAFTLMAVLVMRLKLFMVPHMASYSSFVTSRKLFTFIRVPRHIHKSLVITLIALASYQGLGNVQIQWSLNRGGQFDDVISTERFLEWVDRNTSVDSVFGGSMPTMSAIRLSTGRRIINHPHYENSKLRDRTKMVYSIYSRKRMDEVWKLMRKLRVQYVVLEPAWCNADTIRQNCSMAELWDLEDRQNIGGRMVCEVLLSNTSPEPFFKVAYKNVQYRVLKVEDVI